MVTTNNTVKLKLTPLARLYFSFSHELDVVSGYITDHRYERLLKMAQAAEARRDGLIKSMFALDAIALLLIFGKGITIPGLNISLSDFPAAREVITFLSASAFFFLASAFLNVSGYSALIDVINQRRTKGTILDPNFLTAADKFYEFTVKLYSPTLNSFAPDVLSPSKAFTWTCRAVFASLFLVIISLLLLHCSVAALSVVQTLKTGIAGPLSYALAAAIVLPNLGGLIISVSSFIKYEFTIIMAPALEQTQTIADQLGTK